MNTSYAQVTEDIHDQMVAVDSDMFLLSMENERIRLLTDIFKQRGLEEICANDLSGLRSEIEVHQSYPAKTSEWASIYSNIVSLVPSTAPTDASETIEEPEEDEEPVDEELEVEDGEDYSLQLRKSIEKDLTYIPQIKSRIILIIGSNNRISTHYKVSIQFIDAIKGALTAVKQKAREVSEFLGISGVLIILVKLMAKSKWVEVPVRILGTIFCGFCIVLAALVAAMRWSKNPIEKLFNWLTDLLGIKIPGGDEE